MAILRKRSISTLSVFSSCQCNISQVSPTNNCNQGHLGQFICWGDSQLGSLCTSCTLFFLLHILNLFVNIKSCSILWIIHLFCRWERYVQLWPLEKYDVPRQELEENQIPWEKYATAVRLQRPTAMRPPTDPSDLRRLDLETGKHINGIPNTT